MKARLKMLWHILRFWKRGFVLISSDKVNTYAMADMTRKELVDAASHLTEIAGNTIEQDIAVNVATQIANGQA